MCNPQKGERDRDEDREREGEIYATGMHVPLICAAGSERRRDALSASALHFVTSTLNNRFIKIHGESSETGLYLAPLGPHESRHYFTYIPLFLRISHRNIISWTI